MNIQSMTQVGRGVAKGGGTVCASEMKYVVQQWASWRLHTQPEIYILENTPAPGGGGRKKGNIKENEKLQGLKNREKLDLKGYM